MIIVGGIQRTGTSLMMDILESNGFKILKTEMEFEKDNFFKDLQPNYNEHSLFSEHGINKETIKGYEEILKNKKLCCKIMASALDKIDEEGLKYVDKIIIMVRNWRDQTSSWKPVTIRNIENMYEKLKDQILNKEEFLNDRLYDAGILYGIEYIKILNVIKKYKIKNKCFIIDFDILLNNFKFISRTLQKPLKIKLKDYGIIKKNTSKKQTDFEEFKEGFFKFLDKLEIKLKYGNIDNQFIIEYRKWMLVISNYIIEKELFTRNKYGLIIKCIK